MKTIYITKTGGEVSEYESKLKAILSTIRNGEYELSISKRKEKRSCPQNRLFWMWVKCVADELKATPNDVHDYYCEKFLKRPIMMNGVAKMATGGTSGLIKEQFTNFLNQMQADVAAEYGITLPTPDDLYFEDLCNHYEQSTK